MALNLEATVGLNSASFERGMMRVKDSVSDSIKAFALGAIGVGTVEEAFRRTMETADELVNSAKKLDMTVEQVQLLRQAAKDTGVEFDTLAKSIEKIDEARAKALGGGAEGIRAMAAFGALGINKQDLLTKTAADLFTGQLSTAVKSNNIETITGPLKEILGRGAQDAVGALKTNFVDLGNEMKKTGAIMDGEVAAKLKQIGDEFNLLSQIVVSQLAPAFLKLAEWVATLILKGGGTIATASAVAGSMVGQAGWIGAGKDLAASAAQEFKNLLGGKGFALTKEQNEAIDKAYGIDSGIVRKAATDASEPWMDALQRIQNAGKELEHPKPDFTKTMEDAQKMTGAARKPESDALIKVGNYLGSNRSSIANSTALLEQHAKATAQNTQRIYEKLDTLMGHRAVDGASPSLDRIFSTVNA